jgi:hypothetical protein
MGETVSVWYDEAGDYLEVLFAHQKGYFRETDNDAMMEKVNEAGQIIGFYPEGQCAERSTAPRRHAQAITCRTS